MPVHIGCPALEGIKTDMFSHLCQSPESFWSFIIQQIQMSIFSTTRTTANYLDPVMFQCGIKVILNRGIMTVLNHLINFNLDWRILKEGFVNVDYFLLPLRCFSWFKSSTLSFDDNFLSLLKQITCWNISQIPLKWWGTRRICASGATSYTCPPFLTRLHACDSQTWLWCNLSVLFSILNFYQATKNTTGVSQTTFEVVRAPYMKRSVMPASLVILDRLSECYWFIC